MKLCYTSVAPMRGREAGVEGVKVVSQPIEEWPVHEAKDVEILFCTHPPKNLDAFTGARWMQLESSGYSHLFPWKLGSRGITVTNARGVFDLPIAEWNIAMIINLSRDLRTLIRHQEARIWDRAERFTSEVRGRVVGIWGYGGIGRATARLAKALGMTVHVLSRSGKKERSNAFSEPGTGDPEGELPDRYFTMAEKEEFLRGLDFLILAMPLTPQTEGMVGEEELRALPKGAYLLNPARGPIVKEGALLAVLRDGHLGGAALDTHYHYPLWPDHPLWVFPNVILTPHIAGTAMGPHFERRVLAVFRENTRRYLAGEPLLNVVSPEELG